MASSPSARRVRVLRLVPGAAAGAALPADGDQLPAGPIWGGDLVGGIRQTALILGPGYVVGLVVPWFLPETKGRLLPERLNRRLLPGRAGLGLPYP